MALTVACRRKMKRKEPSLITLSLVCLRLCSFVCSLKHFTNICVLAVIFYFFIKRINNPFRSDSLIFIHRTYGTFTANWSTNWRTSSKVSTIDIQNSMGTKQKQTAAYFSSSIFWCFFFTLQNVRWFLDRIKKLYFKFNIM